MRKLALLAACAALSLPAMANAGQVITNGTVSLGVESTGQLNFGGVGVASNATGNDGTIAGCPCEGWGAAVAGTGISVYGNNSTGTNATVVNFSSTATTATSEVSNNLGGAGQLGVKHEYKPSASSYLYQVDVTITNLTASDFAGDTLYRRAMDWDIPPTTFNEYTTIQGTAGAANVTAAGDNGFCNTNILSGSCGGAPADFVDLGPSDHGASFDFAFAPLAAGASRTLTIFYGVAPNESLALTALNAVGAEIYSFGQASNFGAAGTASRETFIFGFKGVGGVVVPPTGAVPEPATWAMMILGFSSVGALLRNRRRNLATA